MIVVLQEIKIFLDVIYYNYLIVNQNVFLLDLVKQQINLSMPH